MERSKLTQMNNLKKEVLLSAKSERVEMTLNTESALASGLLIQRLTELYEDPVEATVRETISNALDATTLAHSGERPVVRVSAPTNLNPVLIVKDNGVGMTYEDLKNIYSKYGASTKVNDLEQIGAYGLGAKAPLAYGTEFTVTSIKDNEKTTIIVAREEMTNYIKIVDSTHTDEPSGTTVSIPINNSDISRFNEHVDRYFENPIDKNVDLYINSKLVKNDNYALITDKALIADGVEKTYGRVWIDPSSVIRLITDLSVDDIRHSLKFLIGGWAYESPSYRNNRYYRSIGKGIIVELKAGIVGFNSSRDAILENDRYTALESLVIDYISSEQFVKDLTKGINNMELSEFKSIVGKLLSSHRRLAKIVDQKIVIEDLNTQSRYSNISRNYKFEDFVHQETGFTINDLLTNIPKKSKPTVVFSDRKYSYHKTSKNRLMSKKLSDYNMFSEINISDLNDEIDSIMNNKSEGHSLENLMLNLAIYGYSKENYNAIVTFITDIADDEDIRKLKTSRKSIVKMRNEGLQETEYNSIIIYTKHNANEIKLMMNEHFENLNFKVYTAEETFENLKVFRAKNKKVIEKKEEKLSTVLNKLDLTKDYMINVGVDSLTSEKQKVFIVAKERYVDKSRINMMFNWYCNENNVNQEDIEMYVSSGNHKASDIQLLMELGEIFRDPSSVEAGRSKLYLEKIHNNVAKLNAIRNESINTNTKAFVRLLSGICGNSPESIRESLKFKFDNVYDIAKIVDIDLPKYPIEALNEFSKIQNQNFADTRRYDWTLETSAISHLLKKVGKKYFDLTHDLISLISNERIVIVDEDNFNRFYSREDVSFTSELVEKVYKEKTGSKNYNKLLKSQIEGYIEFMKSIIEEMSIIK